jgi:THO complex subunit 1 transcription elongation factor
MLHCVAGYRSSCQACSHSAQSLVLPSYQGVNKEGLFDTDNVTILEDEDASMQIDGEEQSIDGVFYRVFWSCQNFFSNPLSLLDRNNYLDAKKVSASN